MNECILVSYFGQRYSQIQIKRKPKKRLYLERTYRAEEEEKKNGEITVTNFRGEEVASLAMVYGLRGEKKLVNKGNKFSWGKKLWLWLWLRLMG